MKGNATKYLSFFHRYIEEWLTKFEVAAVRLQQLFQFEANETLELLGNIEESF